MSTVNQRETKVSPKPAQTRPWYLARHFWVDASLVLAAFLLNLLVRSRIEGLGDTAYLRFLRSEWVLVAGGNGLQLDFAGLPLPPVLYIATSVVFGTSITETWLPIVLNVGVMLVLVRSVLRVYPAGAKLVAGVLLLASPFYFLLQQQLNIQLFVLLLALQLTTLRTFRLQPTVGRVTTAILLNVALSLVSFAALIAIAAAVIYLLFIASYRLASRPKDVNAAAWRALLWVYLPFSLSGYLLWAAYWAIAGSNLKTSPFVEGGPAGPFHPAELVSGIGITFVVLLTLLLGIGIMMWIFGRSLETRMRGDRTQTVGWIVLAFMATASTLIAFQTIFQVLPIRSGVIAASLSVLVPAAVGSVFGQARNIFHVGSLALRLMLTAALALTVAALPLQYFASPTVLKEVFPTFDNRAVAAREAAADFEKADPGGRILLDPRFTPTFVLSAGIDPDRLLTPFDKGFERIVSNPPNDVHTVVVTDNPDDLVAGNHPDMRLLEFLPSATLLGEGNTESFYVRAFEREPYELPTKDLERRTVEPYAEAEERLLAEVKRRLGPNMLPTRTDEWAYAVDVGNLLLYAAERGDAQLLARMDAVVREHYLTTDLADPRALYTVAWRAREDRPAEASGTTETLRMLEGYVAAAERWDDESSVRLAHALALAYAKHEQPATDFNRWFIRNYYNYVTKEYATNTFTVDYYPAVLYHLAELTEDETLRRIADKSTAHLREAQHRSGLFYEMYQPEIQTIYPDIDDFSPNSMSRTHDSAEIALGLVGVDNEAARRTHRFIRERYPYLSADYNLTSMSGKDNPPPALWANEARLAVALGEEDFARKVADERIVPFVDELISKPDNDGSWFFNAITTLLALREVQAGLAVVCC